MYKVQVTPLIGLPRFDGWAHVTTIANGRVVWAISVAGQHARNIGRDLLDVITAAGEINDGAALYSLVTKLLTEAQDKEGELSLACGWLNDQGKSVFCCYQGSIVLKRSDKAGQLLQANKQLRVIEGSVNPEDVYIFATAQAAQFLGEVQQKLEQGYEIDTIVTSITPSLHLEETTALSAMAFVKQEELVKSSFTEPVVPEFSGAVVESSPFFSAEESGVSSASSVGLVSSTAVGLGTDMASTDMAALDPEPFSKASAAVDSFTTDTPGAFSVPSTTEPVGNVGLQQPTPKPPVDWTQVTAKAKGVGAQLSKVGSLLMSQVAKVGPVVAALKAKQAASMIQAASTTTASTSVGSVTTAPTSSPPPSSTFSPSLEPAPEPKPAMPIDSYSSEPPYLSSSSRSQAGGSVSSFTASDGVVLPSFLKPAASNVSFGQEVYVGTAARRQSLRTILLFATVVLIIVGVAGFFLFRRQQEVAEATTALQPFEQQVQQARDTVNQDPIAARASLQQAIAGIETLQVTFRDKSAGLQKIDASLTEAKSVYDEVSGREEFSELPVFFNSRTDTMDIVITQSGMFKDAIVFFDAQKKQGAVVKVADKAVTNFTIALDKEITDLATNVIDDTIWVLTDAVHRFDPSQANAEPEEELAPSDRLSGGRLVSIFSNAVYVFSPSERTILKYTEEDDTFTGPVKWLRSAPGLDFEQVVSMVVDGDIWLTDKKGSIFRLRGGNAQDFSVKGLEQAFNSSLILYTTEESERLYLLEPANHRVVILAKDGTFIREVTSSSLAAASHLVVSPDETKLFAVSGSTVYEVNL